MAHLIVCDDEPSFCGMLVDYLGTAGHAVRTAGDGISLRKLVAEGETDLVILDISLPGEDGLSIARHLRERHDFGIVMLTGADGVVDRIVGLEIGADDYVTKPFSLPELAARIEAVLRRRRTLGNVAAFGTCTVDLKRWRVFDLHGSEIELSGSEIDLIVAFATHPGKLLSRDDLLRLAPANGADPLDRSVDLRITRLRRKLAGRGVEEDAIQTVRGAGYAYHPPKG